MKRVWTLTVRGILWVYDELISRSAITYAQAIESLENMVSKGAWLPNEEVAKRLKLWNSMMH